MVAGVGGGGAAVAVAEEAGEGVEGVDEERGFEDCALAKERELASIGCLERLVSLVVISSEDVEGIFSARPRQSTRDRGILKTVLPPYREDKVVHLPAVSLSPIARAHDVLKPFPPLQE